VRVIASLLQEQEVRVIASLCHTLPAPAVYTAVLLFGLFLGYSWVIPGLFPETKSNILDSSIYGMREQAALLGTLSRTGIIAEMTVLMTVL